MFTAFRSLIVQGVEETVQPLADLSKVRLSVAYTKTGDLAECISIAEDSSVLPQLASTIESCLGSKCQILLIYLRIVSSPSDYADLVVVNHHLFFADMAVKENGFGELIPQK